MDQALEGGLCPDPLSQLPELRVGPALPPLSLGGAAVLGGGVGVGGCDGVVGTGGGGGPGGFLVVLFCGGVRGVGARVRVRRCIEGVAGGVDGGGVVGEVECGSSSGDCETGNAESGGGGVGDGSAAGNVAGERAVGVGMGAVGSVSGVASG